MSLSVDNLSILMVVPSRVQVTVLMRDLNDLGILNVQCCKNIQESLETMRQVKPDLVISSMYFEDGDGIDLITSMRNEPELENILFMLVSSEQRFEMLDPIRQAGVIAVLPKPFNKSLLTQALNSSLNYLEGEIILTAHKDIDSLSVLIVDDSKLARNHIRKVLNKVGIAETQITQAEDGTQAVEQLKQSNFDIVLTDYNMPQMDGEELLKYIRSNSELKAMPVIMVTSEQNEVKLGSIQSNGVTAMLDKPFDPPHLHKLLEIHV